MTRENPRSLIGRLLLLAPLGLVDPAGSATAQTPLSGNLGVADPSAPLALTPAERSAILNAVRQDPARPSATIPANVSTLPFATFALKALGSTVAVADGCAVAVRRVRVCELLCGCLVILAD